MLTQLATKQGPFDLELHNPWRHGNGRQNSQMLNRESQHVENQEGDQLFATQSVHRDDAAGPARFPKHVQTISERPCFFNQGVLAVRAFFRRCHILQSFQVFFRGRAMPNRLKAWICYSVLAVRLYCGMLQVQPWSMLRIVLLL